MLFDVQETEREGWRVLAVVGEFDLATAPRLRQAIIHAVAAPADPAAPAGEGSGSPVRLVVDLTGVDFIDSSGLGVLIGGYRRVRQSGGQLRLIVREPHVQSVFRATDLDRVFAIHSSFEDAVAADGNERGDG